MGEVGFMKVEFDAVVKAILSPKRKEIYHQEVISKLDHENIFYDCEIQESFLSEFGGDSVFDMFDETQQEGLYIITCTLKFEDRTFYGYDYTEYDTGVVPLEWDIRKFKSFSSLKEFWRIHREYFKDE